MMRVTQKDRLPPSQPLTTLSTHHLAFSSHKFFLSLEKRSGIASHSAEVLSASSGGASTGVKISD